MGKPLRVGFIGVGNISSQYLSNIPKLPSLELVGVSDINMERSDQVANEHNIKSMTVEELLKSPDIDAILNITLPQTHASINMQALQHGKHVYVEKPFALSVAEALPVLDLANKKGLRVGCAPDTFLGTGVHTSKHLIHSGAIGEPLAAAAFWSAPGHERWHPNPQFYYLEGAGPLFDMGPYYLTALVFLLGPITSVIGNSTRSGRKRKVHTGPLAETSISVEVDTHISAIMTHASGVQSSIMVSFEAWGSRLPTIEVYGTEGSITVPDPNQFSEHTYLFTQTNQEWQKIEHSAGFKNAGRGIGLADMADAINENREHRASGDLGFHILEVMESILKSSKEEKRFSIKSSVKEIPIKI
jgi:predicted dehydrogenase